MYRYRISIAVGSFVAVLNRPVDHYRAPVSTDLKAVVEEIVDRGTAAVWDYTLVVRPTQDPDGKAIAGSDVHGAGANVILIQVTWKIDTGAVEPDVNETQVARADLPAYIADLDADESEEIDGPESEAELTKDEAAA